MSSFKLKSGDSDFKDRQKKVFDQLQILEKNRKNIVSSNNDIEENKSRTNRRDRKNETRHFRGKESIFKKPLNPAPKNFINRIPDFKKNPHKWTKYSLEDVQEITEESNKKSAMDFLKELANRKKLEQGIMEDEELKDLPSKIMFNKHVKIAETSIKERIGDPEETQTLESTKNNEANERASFANSKLVMPEYVVGQKPTKKDRKIKSRSKIEKGKELRLDHLAFEDE